MTIATRACIACCIWASLTSCNSVGFEESSKVDFSRYPTATIAPFTISSNNSDADPVPAQSISRFVDEVRRLSGFREVRTGDAQSDLTIQVDVTRVSIVVSGNNGVDCCDVVGLAVAAILDTSCADATAYVHVELNVVVTNAQGKKVYSLSEVQADSNSIQCASDRELLDGYQDALDDALDQVAVFFLQGFDI